MFIKTLKITQDENNLLILDDIEALYLITTDQNQLHLHINTIRTINIVC